MEQEIKTKKNPLFHVVRKDNTGIGKNIRIKIIALILAFLVAALILAITTGADIGTFFKSMIDGVFGTERRKFLAIKDLIILLGLALALAPAFKMKFWNTGADGQALAGAITAYLCIHFMKDTCDNTTILIVACISAILAGVLWGVIPAIFKAYFNTNETLFTLMMNYVAIKLTSFFVNTYGKDNKLATFYDFGVLPLSTVKDKFIVPIIIVFVILVVVTIYLKHTKHGFEVSIVGESENTAKYVGINVKWVVIRTMMISGGICGLIGFILTCGFNHSVTVNTLGGQGFTAIIVCWLAGFNPIFMILSAAMVVFLNRGGSQLLTDIGCQNQAIPDILVAIFFFFIIGCTFFSNYELEFRKDENGEIDNPVCRGLSKVLIPVSHFFDACDLKTTEFVKMVKGLIFKQKKNEAVKENSSEATTEIETVVEKNSDEDITEVETIADENNEIIESKAEAISTEDSALKNDIKEDIE